MRKAELKFGCRLISIVYMLWNKSEPAADRWNTCLLTLVMSTGIYSQEYQNNIVVYTDIYIYIYLFSGISVWYVY